MGKRKAEETNGTASKKGTTGLLVDPEKPWYLVKIKEAWEVTGPRPGAAAELADITKASREVYEAQVKAYDAQRDMSKSDRDWLKTVISSGTTSDKCSTYQVQIAEAPLYGAEYLGKLLEMAKSTGRHEASQAIVALEKVFDTLLPPPAAERKLYYLKQRKWSMGVTGISQRTLMIVYFEDAVKRGYFEFLKLLEIMTQDQIAHGREVSMRILCGLGCKKDEQIGNVTGLLANKLGDPDRKLASRAMYYLQEVINGQSKVTETVIGQVEQVIQRPGISEKAQYYGLTFLSQIMLSHGNPEVTDRLVKLYLALLRSTIIPSIVREAEKLKKAKKCGPRKGKKGRKQEKSVEVELAPATSRLAKVVITGLNRALPFYKGSSSSELMTGLAGPLRKLIDGQSFSTSLQALTLYFQLVSLPSGASASINDDSFIKTVEGVLTAKAEATVESSCHPQLLTALYKILSQLDLAISPTERLLKGLFGLVFKVQSTAFTLSALFLLADLLQGKPALKAMLSMPSDEQGSCCWALHILQDHYDERVARLAGSILEGTPNFDLLGGRSPFDVCSSLAALSSLQ